MATASNLDLTFPCQYLLSGCESWTVNKAECRRIDAFELWCWRRLMRLQRVVHNQETELNYSYQYCILKFYLF